MPDYAPPAPTDGTGFAPDPTLGEVLHAGRVRMRSDRSDFENIMLHDGYAPVLDALELGKFDNPFYFPDPALADIPLVTQHYSRLARSQGRSWLDSHVNRRQQEELIAAAIRRRRLQDPDFLAGVPDTVEGLRQHFLKGEKARRAEAGEVLSRSSGVLASGAQFLGGAIEALHDPVNLTASVATAPIGGQGGLLVTFGREALINAGIEAVLQPIVAENRELVGEELTAGEAALNIATAGVAGGALSTGLNYSARGAARLARPLGEAAGAAYDRTVQRIFDAMPESVQKRWAGKMKVGGVDLNDLFADLDNFELADFAEASVGRERMTPDEAAALNVLRRSQEIGDASPFEAGPDGDAVHEQRLGEAIRSILEAPTTRADPRPIGAAPQLTSSTALTPPVPRGIASGGRAQFEARVRGAESGGNDRARNPRSSAAGRYQFTDDTWARYHRRIYGGDGLGDKLNPAKQERLFAELTNDNERALRAFGIPLTAGNYYLAHFAGAGGAAKLHRAPPGASARSVLGAKVVEANPFLANMTARDVIEWAHGKMGESGAAPAAGAGIAFVAEDPAIAALRAEAEAADLEAMALARSAEDELPGSAELDGEPAAVLKRELFDSDEDWVDAQVELASAPRGDVADRIAAQDAAGARLSGETAARAPQVAAGRPAGAPGASEAVEYTIGEARYAKGKVIVRGVADGSGFKTRVDRLAEALGGRWTGRESGYTMSPAAAAKLEKLHAAGFSADQRIFADQPQTFYHHERGLKDLTAAEALRAADVDPGALTREELSALAFPANAKLDALWYAGLNLVTTRELGRQPSPLWGIRNKLTGELAGWSVNKRQAAKEIGKHWTPEDLELEKLTPEAIEAELRQRAADQAEVRSAAGEVRIDDPALRGFDRPEGEGQQSQIESLEHDHRMDAEGLQAQHPVTGETLVDAQARARELAERFPAAEPEGRPGTHNIANSAELAEGGTRGDLRQRIFAAILERPARAEREAHLVLGPPAAGKSSLADPIAEMAGARIIDSDDAKAMLPEYEDGIGAHAVHEESSRIAALAADASIARGDNILLPLVGKTYDGVAARIDELAGAGYRVFVHLVELPAEIATDRAIARFASTGRLVDPDYVRSVGDKPLETFARLLDEYKDKLEGYVHVSNDVPLGERPRLIQASDDALADRLGYARAEEPGEDPRAPQAASRRDVGRAAEAGLPELDEAAAGGSFRLTEDGEERPLAEILDELDRERDALDAMRSCLKPAAAA